MKAWAVVDKETETLTVSKIFRTRQSARERMWRFLQVYGSRYIVVPVEITIIKKKVKEK